ncbi:1-deoxy-D-xylulose-5-phosphate synthase N-terminal domain-containing protein [Spiroplasma endosymbiont of Atherix ibis]|uniref:1-deoxy-D-xylulose-5-phosphate synthase N-terminal domain-containing protein n=1 Tax=Spiroplasma endosymbiont of Atherix ibis TaxID=3066291 RepID=UPI0030D15DFF
MKLSQITNFKELYNIKDNENLTELAQDIRKFLNDFVNKNNGHIGSNLGVTELTLSIFSYFDLDKTIVLFDTGHQSHVYKLLIHGVNKFNTIKQFKCLSNFQEIKESDYDWISTGHSSTALAYQFGYSLVSDKENIISIIGDAAFFGSYTLPGLINLRNSNKKTITILNDNNEAIGVNSLKIKDIKMYVESLDIKYIKCDNGHNFEKLFKSFDKAKKVKNHVFIHCITKKALGYNGEKQLFSNHSVESEINNSYSKIIALEVEKKFTQNDYLICPAMLNSSNLLNLKNKFNKNVIDVGINEEFSILVASAISNCNKKTFVSIYSTFFQRVFDQLVHDVFRNNLAITFLIDRGGLNFSGGVSHHGIYDISLINNFSNAIICQPYSINDVKVLFEHAYLNKDKQFFLRYENLEAVNDNLTSKFKIGEWQELIFNENNKITLISYGKVLKDFFDYIKKNNLEINLINARYINPIDKEMLIKHSKNRIYVYEQVIDKNNLLTNIKSKFNNLNISGFAFNKINIEHGNKDLILKDLDMDVKDIINKIVEV